MDEVETIARCMALYARSPDVQVIQTAHRKRLAEAWGIAPGSRILEIGCGQGDLTAVLAHAVGPEGRVTAYDLAAPDYGAPVTIGDSAEFLRRSPLGPRIDFHLNSDVLAEPSAFSADSFDAVVFAHCSWYFSSTARLGETLRRVRPWARTLCLSEWDLVPRGMGQLAHMLSVLIQGQAEAFVEDSSSNVRTPFTREVLAGLLRDAGWREVSSSRIESPELQDARWELSACLGSEASAREGGLPARFADLLGIEEGILRGVAEAYGVEPLSSFAISAVRSTGAA